MYHKNATFFLLVNGKESWNFRILDVRGNFIKKNTFVNFIIEKYWELFKVISIIYKAVLRILRILQGDVKNFTVIFYKMSFQ